MVLWLDVPRTVEAYDLQEQGLLTEIDRSAGSPQDGFAVTALQWGDTTFRLILWVWPLFIAEQAWHFFSTRRGESFRHQHRYWWAFCLCPPLRMCARHRGSRDRIWLPWLGWQIADHALQRRLERAFSLPMIGIALLILPVLGLQAIYQEQLVNYPALRIALHVGTGIIWFAFAFELIVMVSVTPRKLAYCRQHWLDLVIILLPLISFLRSLRLLRMSKLLNVSKLQQLSRMTRVYRLRGVALRGWRALLLLDVAQRLLFLTPEKQIRRLEELCLEKERELAQIRAQIEELHTKRAALSTATDSKVVGKP